MMKGLKPKVLLLGPEPPPMGGISRYCKDIMESRYLNDRYDMRFMSTTIPDKYRKSAHYSRKQLNIFVRDGLYNGLIQYAIAADYMRKYTAVLHNNIIDVVHIPTGTGMAFWRNSLHAAIAKVYGAKVLFHLLGEIDVFWRNGSSLQKLLIKECLDLAAVNVVQSDGIRAIVSNITNRPVVSIYNGIAVDHFYPDDGFAHSDRSKGIIQVTNLGILGERKGYCDLIKAASRLMQEMPTIKYIFIGGGDVERFRKMVQEHRLEDRIWVTGEISDIERIRILKTSDIFAMPTYAEGQPIALLEAMASGLPIISTPVGSIGEIVSPSGGILNRPGDIEALVKSIRYLADNQIVRERMGKYNCQTAKMKYSVSRTMNDIGDTYASII